MACRMRATESKRRGGARAQVRGDGGRWGDAQSIGVMWYVRWYVRWYVGRWI